jgi:DNA-binding TFAR19-related protein (PDSD5 family)
LPQESEENIQLTAEQKQLFNFTPEEENRFKALTDNKKNEFIDYMISDYIQPYKITSELKSALFDLIDQNEINESNASIFLQIVHKQPLKNPLPIIMVSTTFNERQRYKIATFLENLMKKMETNEKKLEPLFDLLGHLKNIYTQRDATVSITEPLDQIATLIKENPNLIQKPSNIYNIVAQLKYHPFFVNKLYLVLSFQEFLNLADACNTINTAVEDFPQIMIPYADANKIREEQAAKAREILSNALSPEEKERLSNLTARGAKEMFVFAIEQSLRDYPEKQITHAKKEAMIRTLENPEQVNENQKMLNEASKPSFFETVTEWILDAWYSLRDFLGSLFSGPQK